MLLQDSGEWGRVLQETLVVGQCAPLVGIMFSSSDEAGRVLGLIRGGLGTAPLGTSVLARIVLVVMWRSGAWDFHPPFFFSPGSGTARGGDRGGVAWVLFLHGRVFFPSVSPSSSWDRGLLRLLLWGCCGWNRPVASLTVSLWGGKWWRRSVPLPRVSVFVGSVLFHSGGPCSERDTQCLRRQTEGFR